MLDRELLSGKLVHDGVEGVARDGSVVVEKHGGDGLDDPLLCANFTLADLGEQPRETRDIGGRQLHGERAEVNQVAEGMHQ